LLYYYDITFVRLGNDIIFQFFSLAIGLSAAERLRSILFSPKIKTPKAEPSAFLLSNYDRSRNPQETFLATKTLPSSRAPDARKVVLPGRQISKVAWRRPLASLRAVRTILAFLMVNPVRRFLNVTRLKAA